MSDHQTIWTLTDGRWTAVMVIEPPKRARQDSIDESNELDEPPDTVESAPDTLRDAAPLTQSSF